MPTRLVDHTLLLKGDRYHEARDLHWILVQYRVLFKQQHHLIFYVVYISTRFDRGGPMGHSFGCGEGSCFDRHQRHVRAWSALPSGCPVYGAFVAAVLTMVSLLA